MMEGSQNCGVGGWVAVMEGRLMLRTGLFRNVLALSAVLRTD